VPNCDFYGVAADHKHVLEWLFSEATCDVYELASDYEAPLRQFKSPEEVLLQFKKTYTTGRSRDAAYLQLYVHGAGPSFLPRRVTLNPKACDGAIYKFNAEGWGLVQLYLSAPTATKLEASHTNHHSMKSAARIATASDLNEWDFKVIQAFSSKLNRQIKKLSVGNLGSRPVLDGARIQWNQGISLWPNVPRREAPRWTATSATR